MKAIKFEARPMLEDQVQDRLNGEPESHDGGIVRVDLPWVPLGVGEGVRLTQVVLGQYAAAVEEAIGLYMECRERALDPSLISDLTINIWRVLQAAHPHDMWQWWDWDTSYEQFTRQAEDYLRRAAA